MLAEKQTAKTEVQIDDYNFYIAPFSAFDATIIFGDLVSVLGPVLAGVSSIFDAVSGEKSIGDVEFSEISPIVTAALAGITGDKLSSLIKNLLIDKRKISFNSVNETRVVYLDMDTFNEIFCQDILGVYQLCFEVIKLNYSSFFTNLTTRFGNLTDILTGGEVKNMANSTESDSQTLN